MNKNLLLIIGIIIIIIIIIILYYYFKTTNNYIKKLDEQNKRIENFEKIIELFNLDKEDIINFVKEIEENNSLILNLDNEIKKLNNNNVELKSLYNSINTNNNNVNISIENLEKVLNSIKNSDIPSNTIIAFNGTSIPEGWVECDGKNFTPDLRSKMIIGRNNTNNNLTIREFGDTGGNELIKIENKNLPDTFNQEPLNIINPFYTLLYLMKI